MPRALALPDAVDGAHLEGTVVHVLLVAGGVGHDGGGGVGGLLLLARRFVLVGLGVVADHLGVGDDQGGQY